MNTQSILKLKLHESQLKTLAQANLTFTTNPTIPTLTIPKWGMIIKGQNSVEMFINLFTTYSKQSIETTATNIAHELLMLHRGLNSPCLQYTNNYYTALKQFEKSSLCINTKHDVAIYVNDIDMGELVCANWGFTVQGNIDIITFIELFDVYFNLSGGIEQASVRGAFAIVDLTERLHDQVSNAHKPQPIGIEEWAKLNSYHDIVDIETYPLDKYFSGVVGYEFDYLVEGEPMILRYPRVGRLHEQVELDEAKAVCRELTKQLRNIAPGVTLDMYEELRLELEHVTIQRNDFHAKLKSTLDDLVIAEDRLKQVSKNFDSMQERYILNHEHAIIVDRIKQHADKHVLKLDGQLRTTRVNLEHYKTKYLKSVECVNELEIKLNGKG